MPPLAAAPLKETSEQARPSDARRWLLGLAVVTGCSWARLFVTGSLKVDENHPSDPAGTLLFLALLSGWALLLIGWGGLLARPAAHPQRLAFAGLLLAAFMLPMLSNDIFSLLAYGSLAAKGRDVYTTASWLPHDVWYPWMGARWTDKVCVYGPATLFGVMPAAFAGGNPWIALFVIRVVWFVPLALVMHLSFQRLSDRPLFHAMVWLNPLWIVEGPGQLHADLLGLAAITAGIVLQQGGRARTGWFLYALATLSKYTFAMTGVWFWLSGADTIARRAVRIPAMVAVVLGLGVLLFAPFWRGAATWTEPLRALASMNPGGSIADVVGTAVRVLQSREMPRPDLPVGVAIEIDRARSAATWIVVSFVMRIVALAVGLRALGGMLRVPASEGRIALGTGVLIVAVATLASHRFQSWYLIAALPFFGLQCTESWRRWWMAAVSTSVSVEFASVLPDTSLLFAAWGALSTAAVVVVFLMSFRARYFSPEETTPADA